MWNKFMAKVDAVGGRFLAAGAIIGTTLIALVSPDVLESFVKHLSDASQNQFAKDCFIFSLAAAIHSGRVKREIRTTVDSVTTSLTAAIDRVAAAFREDLRNHSDKLDNLANRVASLESLQTEKIKKGD